MRLKRLISALFIMYRTIFPNIRCGLKIKKKFSCRQPTFHKSAGGGGGVGVVWVWVCCLILLSFSHSVWSCRLLFVPLQRFKIHFIGGGLIRENGVATFHKCTLKVGKMHLCWVFCCVFLKIEKG